MKQMLNSLYGKLSVIFLVLLLVLGAVQYYISREASMDFVAETDQKLNRTLAQDLAKKFGPYLVEKADYDAIEHSFKELMVMNPRVEIYLIDEAGNLLAYFADPEKIKRMSVDMAPIRDYLRSDEPLSMPIYGDDPRSVDRHKPFSVTPVQIGKGQAGYLYVILGGEQYDSVLSMVEESYTVQTSAFVLGGAFALTGVAGLLLFFVLTKRLRVMTGTVQKFERGNYQERISVQTGDEIGQLGRAFNQMADTIEANVEQLKKNDVLRRELVANISHDLRSPLASIQGYLETVLMKGDDLAPEKRHQFLNTIFHNVTTLNRLVSELFELSKLDAKQVAPECEPFSMAELVQDTILEFQVQAEENGVRLSMAPPEDLPLVFADIGMMSRVLSNLIENAVRYTPQGGEVKVSVTKGEEGVHVSVADTGQGISTEDLPQIFDRFFRAEKSRSKGGTGLGLAIAQKIVEAHGRKINVSSQLNKGTTFGFDVAVSV